MTDLDLVARLADEARLAGPIDGELITHWNGDVDLTPYLARFAALVAAECAKVCDGNVPPLERYQEQRAAGNTARACAAAIRARFVHSPKPLT